MLEVTAFDFNMNAHATELFLQQDEQVRALSC